MRLPCQQFSVKLFGSVHLLQVEAVGMSGYSIENDTFTVGFVHLIPDCGADFKAAWLRRRKNRQPGCFLPA